VAWRKKQDPAIYFRREFLRHKARFAKANFNKLSPRVALEPQRPRRFLCPVLSSSQTPSPRITKIQPLCVMVMPKSRETRGLNSPSRRRQPYPPNHHHARSSHIRPPPMGTCYPCASGGSRAVVRQRSCRQRVAQGKVAALVLRLVFLVAIQAFLSLCAQSLCSLSACRYTSSAYRLGEDEITIEVG
jgi:hypothetical protein